MIKKRVVKTTVEVTEAVYCNKCGKSVAYWSYAAHVHYSGGYESSPSKCDVDDGDTFDFDLCEDCLSKLMKSFKLPPTYSNYLFSRVATWRGWRKRTACAKGRKSK